MCEMAASYDGPHFVKVRRSDKNKGLIRHINDVAGVSSGEIIVMAAGDDVSLPYRAEHVAKVFTDYPNIFALYTGFFDMRLTDVDETLLSPMELPVFLRTITLSQHAFLGGGTGNGATYAYRRDCFHWPAAIPDECQTEDRILPMRAAILGDVAYSTARTVLYLTRASGDSWAERGLDPLNLKSHVRALLRELKLARKSQKLSFWEFCRCWLIIRVRHATYCPPTYDNVNFFLKPRCALRYFYRKLGSAACKPLVAKSKPWNGLLP